MTRTALWMSSFLKAASAAIVLASLALASPASAQQSGGEGSRIPPIDVAATFTAEHAKISPSDCGCFWLQGGSAEANVYLFRGLSAAAELTGSHGRQRNAGSRRLADHRDGRTALYLRHFAMD